MPGAKRNGPVIIAVILEKKAIKKASSEEEGSVYRVVSVAIKFDRTKDFEFVWYEDMFFRCAGFFITLDKTYFIMKPYATTVNNIKNHTILVPTLL
ncbi:hypothetical protein [Rossellomorea vietnamensis]|uniref:Uncharacterized protein n=1 Tax=Rossellomorea vietnamensis TaxID=218284 RepID=A0A0P6W1V5_9BACI|nr:hypothetical protein [Rossellomorea vietnamensis]KPL59827.1 hypothetical protein AM506_10260 [Rossellomorea vietnamensis]